MEEKERIQSSFYSGNSNVSVQDFDGRETDVQGI